jgi:hypothetical protein
MRILASSALGVFALSVAFQGMSSPAQEKGGRKLKAEDVLKEWVFPEAEVHGPNWPRDDEHADLANAWFAPKEPMEKVWKYYAGRCGHKGKFPGPGAGSRAGTGNDKARYLMTCSGGSNRSKTYRCTFAYNTGRYMVFVELASDWEGESTAVEVTVGTR